MVKLNKSDYELVEVIRDNDWQCDLCCFGSNKHTEHKGLCYKTHEKAIKSQLGKCGLKYWKKIEEEIW